MARINGSGGSIATLTNFVSDFDSWNIRGIQPIVDDTSFTDTTLGASHVGVGTVTYMWRSSGFGKDGASNDPGLSDFTATGIASVVFTAKSGCTFTATALVEEVDVSHFKRGVMRTNFSGMLSGNITTAWA